MKKLTINSIALGNLKQRRRQYAVMIIGIVLAMVFSSSVIFMLSAMKNSVTEMRNARFGKQSVIWSNVTEDNVEKAKENKIFGKSGYAHILGTVSGTNEEFNGKAKLAYLDDEAFSLANPVLIEGKMPEKENEIAVEKMTLAKLGVNANVGDEVTFNFRTQNGEETLDNIHEVTYKLVGILKNKVSYISFMGGIDGDDIPSAFVYKNAVIEPGGKESLVCYANYYGDTEYAYGKTYKYLKSLGYNPTELSFRSFSDSDVLYNTNDSEARDVTQKNIFIIVIIAVLMVSSCLVIVNSFNSNLNERKKQIGMYRAIGATKKQIRDIYAREALIISLITAPGSCLISALIVKGIIALMGEGFAFKLNLWVVLLSLLFCIVCVMLSALIPLISASKISPMQSIRNIEATRIFHKKHIKSKKNFNVPRLIAGRSLTFGKGKQVTVSLILAVAIIGSGYAVSYYDYTSKNPVGLMNDYELVLLTGHYSCVNYKSNNPGFSEYDRWFIENNKYIGESSGKKTGGVTMIVPIGDSEYRKYYSSLFSLEVYDEEKIKSAINSNKSLITAYSNGDTEKEKKLLNADEFITTSIISYDAKYLESLKRYVYDGKIDIEKINSGEEVILNSPKKIGAYFEESKNGNKFTVHFESDDVIDVHNCFFKAENDFHAGDEIEIAIMTADAPIKQKVHDPNVSQIPDNVKIEHKKVKIGALVDSTHDLSIITSTSVLNSFIPNLKYDELSFNLSTVCTDEVDKSVMEDIQEVASNVEDAHFISNYGFAQRQREDANKTLIVMMSIVILLFVISISIINNTLSSDIKNSKSKIGTLRAVGADENCIVKSYIHQLLSMLLWGSGIGLIGFFGSFGIYALYCHQTDNHFDMIFNPSAAIVFILLAFLVCSLNLWLKVRKEMKNSIVENIREL